MTSPLFIDIETFSSVDLRSSNVYSYVESPDFEIMMAGWGFEDGPIHLAVGSDEIRAIPGLADPSVVKVAHNAQFERVAFSAFYGTTVGYLPPEEWVDTMAYAAAWGYPRKLESLAVALGAEEKDSAGTRLINLFCKPGRNGERTLPEDKPGEWERFKEYCRQDVVSLRDICFRLLDRGHTFPTDTEERVFLADQRINDRGIPTDVEMAEAAVLADEANRMEQELEVTDLTGVLNPASQKQLLGWLQESGLDIPDLKAATVKAALLRDDLSDDQRRVLEIRQDLALTAASKYNAALDKVSEDNRLRGSFQYFGAHTGRWAGRGVQLQNLPSASLESEEASEDAIMDLKLGLGADSYTLKALVRQLFIGPFTVVDYSAIEARVIAWLAGERWALDAFADGRDIYVETAERMGGLTRKEGKVAVLALGYQGGVGSLSAMGAEGDKDHLQFLVNQWRGANSNIVDLWAEMDHAFRAGDQPVGDRLYMGADGRDRYLKLPSGRYLVYRDLKARWKTTPWGAEVKQVSFSDPKKPGLRTDTYGGRLTENATQAVARDILAEALVRLEHANYDVVGHVHDEILVSAENAVEDVSRIMTINPAWSEGLPLAAEGFACQRYRKD